MGVGAPPLEPKAPPLELVAPPLEREAALWKGAVEGLPVGVDDPKEGKMGVI